MNYRPNVLVLIHIMLVLLVCNCAAFPDPVTSKERKFQPINREKVRLLFTGFYRYEKEKNTIHNTLIKRGLLEDPSSQLELELILQKKEPVYQYLFLHRVNILLTFFTGGFVPSHIRTEQTLTFRYSKLGVIERESVYEIGMDQWRGIPVIIFMITQWPNRIYKEQLIDATELEMKDI
ncbi:hypothetical protein [Leptospira perdikensis]|uniref:Lipoprotein n=1 Tax=Leptospira perdikensis TaxID=2484948 RepID=A0A4R9JJR9_9LEPT|nr:hypothetical protein [Leptospira perdikensis]TGL44785.1 hypothetical protein EHQ49_04780 [Leptospira perdikensis]